MSFVLDNVVLSSFDAAGWFDSLSWYPPDETLRVPERIWTGEFLPGRDVDAASEWLTVESVDERSRTGAPGALSQADEACLALADRHASVLVTNDKQLIHTRVEGARHEVGDAIRHRDVREVRHLASGLRRWRRGVPGRRVPARPRRRETDASRETLTPDRFIETRAATVERHERRSPVRIGKNAPAGI